MIWKSHGTTNELKIASAMLYLIVKVVLQPVTERGSRMPVVGRRPGHQRATP